ncbi:NLRC3 [Symbiodinium sp. KB8]|nr:NLRC3 [Symbiodinium sp. KB8]
MHVLYAHECTRTFRIENLTPDDVWEAASKNSEYRVRVYDARSAVVRDRPLKELVANRVLYGTRGWCKAEVEWSSARSHSQQNHRIDAPESQQRNEEESEGEQEPELLGKVPMAPEIFAEEMNLAAFTHRSDAEEVKKLQFKVFLQKVSECEEALFEYLPEGQFGQLAKALPYFQKLRVLRLRDFEVGRAEAGEFAKAGLRRSKAVCALARNEAIRELEIEMSLSGHGRGFLWEVVAEALKTNSTLTSISLHGSWIHIGVEGCKAICEALKRNSTLTHIYLGCNGIGDEGAQAIADALKSNSTLTRIQLDYNCIGSEGGKAICEALKSNSTLTSISLHGAWIDIGVEGCKAICEALKRNSRLTHINLEQNDIGDEGAQAIADALKSNSTLTRIQLASNRIGNEGGKAICEALKTNSSLASISLEGNNDISEQVLAEIETRCLLEAPEAAKAWTGRVRIEAICEALKTNSTLTSISLESNDIRDEGAEAIAEALKTNSTLTSINLEDNEIGLEGAEALAKALNSNTAVCKIQLWSNNIPRECEQALAEATGGRLRTFL